MEIAVYAICHNEEYMLPFFLRHYQSFVSQITVYDNHSTDRSVHILNAAGITVDYFESDNSIRDDIMLKVKNHFWKASRHRHDWVIVVDIDELIHVKNIKQFLIKHEDKTLIIPTGYNMFSETLPTVAGGQIYDQAKMGTPNPQFCNKPCMFRPDKIKEINFEVGCHQANPVGEVFVHRSENLKLLHFDYLTLPYRIEKCQTRGKRQSKLNRINNWGVQYMQSVEELTADYRDRKSKSKIVV